MKIPLLANIAAFALFASLAACLGVLTRETLLFQLVLQLLGNEFWMEALSLPLQGRPLFGRVGVDPRQLRRAARWSCGVLLLFPALVCGGMACIQSWSGGTWGDSLRLPLESALFLSSAAALGLLFVASLVGGLPPLSYRAVADALMARHEGRLMAQGGAAVDAAMPDQPPPTRAGVDMLPHGLPDGVGLADGLRELQCCSPLHGYHAGLVRTQMGEGEVAILSTAPAGVVPLPSSSNERTYGGLGLCLAAALLYTAIGLFEDGTAHAVTRWAALVLGLGLLVASGRLLRASSRRQRLLRQTDYFITNRRLHICRAGQWESVAFASVEALPGGEYGDGRGDVELCPESGPETCKLINVEHAEEICALLERLISLERSRAGRK